MIVTEVHGVNEVSTMLHRMVTHIPDGAKRGLFKLGVNLRNDILVSMQNTVRRSDRVYTRRGITHRPSAPGHPPAIDTGALAGSIIVESEGDWVRVGSIITDPEYPDYLEVGTYKMDERPWMLPAVTDMMDAHPEQIILNEIMRTVE